jgi:flagellar biogenesis protein FliO
MTGTYIQMAGALTFVLLLIFGVSYMVRKKQNRLDLMSVISYQNIGPKKGVAALKIGKEVLILGVTTNEVRLLKTFQDTELNLDEAGGFHSKLERFKKAGVINN